MNQSQSEPLLAVSEEGNLIYPCWHGFYTLSLFLYRELAEEWGLVTMRY